MVNVNFNESQNRRVRIAPINPANGLLALQLPHLFLGLYDPINNKVLDFNGFGSLRPTGAEVLVKGIKAEVFPYIPLTEFRQPNQYTIEAINRVSVTESAVTHTTNSSEVTELRFTLAAQQANSEVVVVRSGTLANGEKYTDTYYLPYEADTSYMVEVQNKLFGSDGVKYMVTGDYTYKFYQLVQGGSLPFTHMVVLEHYI